MESEATQLRGRSAAITISLVILALLALSVGIRLLRSGEPVAHRIVVGADGCGAECDRMLARRFAARLSELGFDAVAPQRDDDALSGPEAVRTFAREHGARFGVMVQVAMGDSAALGPDAGQRVKAHGTLYVLDAADDTTPEPTYHLRSIEEGLDPRATRAMLAKRLLEGLYPMTASTLLSSEPVTRLLRETSSMEQQAAALVIKRRERDVEARREAIREYRLQCEANDELLATAGGARCVSDGCAEEYLVGVLPDGQHAVVHDSTNEAIFPLQPDSTARSFLTAERLWLVPREGERTLLAEAANFHSRPDLSRDGSTLAFLERRHGLTRLYAMALDTRERVLLSTTRAPTFFSKPRLSPDGSRVLYFSLAAAGGEAALMVAPVEHGAAAHQLARHALDARWVRMRADREEPERLMIAALVPGEPDAAPAGGAPTPEPGVVIVDALTGEVLDADPPLPEVWLLDPDGGEVLAKLDAPERRIRAIGDVYDGALLLSWHEEVRCGFARYRPGEPAQWRVTELCPKHLAVGTGGVFAHARRDDGRSVRQIVRLDPETGKMKRLTRGPHDAQRPKPATAGNGYAFERVLPRRFGEFQHVAVCFGE